MELLKDFYTHIPADKADEANEAATTFHIRLNAEHPIYRGHFPEQPVVPGVCLLQIVKECAEKSCGQELQYMQISSCKFLMAVNPMKTPELRLTLDTEEAASGAFKLYAEGETTGVCCLKLKAALVKRV